MAEGSFSLEYELNNATHRIDYSWDDNANYRFIFVDNDGEQVLEEYSKNARPASAPREQIPARSKGPKPENQQPRKFLWVTVSAMELRASSSVRLIAVASEA